MQDRPKNAIRTQKIEKSKKHQQKKEQSQKTAKSKVGGIGPEAPFNTHNAAGAAPIHGEPKDSISLTLLSLPYY